MKWRHWQEECKRRLESGEFAADNHLNTIARVGAHLILYTAGLFTYTLHLICFLMTKKSVGQISMTYRMQVDKLCSQSIANHYG